MPQVELIYDSDCPNIRDARKALLEGFARAGLEPSWTEWDRKSPESPAHALRYGSPTVLVDGRDVAVDIIEEPSADSCRVYDHGPGGLKGVPPVSRIAAALGHATQPDGYPNNERHWWRFSASLPAVGAAFLPVGFCPACWPAYAGVLGALGLGFLLDRTYLLPLTTALFGLALLALAFRAKSRRGYGPFVLGVLSAGLMLAFKFAYVLAPLAYAGLAGFLAASLWNAWPKQENKAGSCPKCVGQAPVVETENAPHF